MPRRFDRNEIDELRSLRIARPGVTPQGLISPQTYEDNPGAELGPEDEYVPGNRYWEVEHEVPESEHLQGLHFEHPRPDCPWCHEHTDAYVPFGERPQLGGGPEATANPYWAKVANQFIKERDGKWVVIKHSDGSVISTHDSKEKAEDSFQAMMMHKHGGLRWGAPVFNEPFIPPAQTGPGLVEQERLDPGTVEPCENCGQPVRNFSGQGGRVCPNCGHENVLSGGHTFGKTADASMPPEASVPQHETAAPYNPAAYESMVEDMHPAAKYTYERSVQQGANPQAAIQAAQSKQQEMANRALQGQDIEGVQQTAVGDMGQQPVMAKADDVEKNPVAEILQNDFDGFVPVATVQRVSKLLS